MMVLDIDPTAVVDRVAVGGTAGLIAGLVFALMAVVFAYQRRFIIQGWLYQEVKDSEKSWRSLSEGQGAKLDRIVTLVEAQQVQLAQTSERGAQTSRTAESNGAKLDRLLAIAETQNRPQR